MVERKLRFAAWLKRAMKGLAKKKAGFFRCWPFAFSRMESRFFRLRVLTGHIVVHRRHVAS